MKQSNFLLVLLLVILERNILFLSASRAHCFNHLASYLSEEEQHHGNRTSSDEEPRSGRIPKRRLSPGEGTKPQYIAKIKRFKDVELIRPVPIKMPNLISREPHYYTEGYKTPPPDPDKVSRLPSSNDSIASSTTSKSNSSANSSSMGSLFSESNFIRLPGNLSLFDQVHSSNSNSKDKHHSKSLIEDSGDGFNISSKFPYFPYFQYIKHDGNFLDALNQNGLGCKSADLDSDKDEENDEIQSSEDDLSIATKEDTVTETGHLHTGTGYRSGSATYELGKNLAATSLGAEHESYFVDHFLSNNQNIFSPEDIKPVEKPSLEIEYAPWLPEDEEKSFLQNAYENCKTDFDLKPLNDQIESVEAPETEEGRNFFRSVFKPFQDYGEFIYDEEKLQAAIETVRPLSQQVTEEIASIREENIKKISREITSVRHEEALKYARAAIKLGLIEGNWIHTIINGGAVDFLSYYKAIQDTEEISKWSVRRGRKLICAMIPSIMFSSNFEEVLIDLLDDFFLSHVLEIENENLQTKEDQEAMLKELIKIGKEMIKHSLSHTIIEAYLIYIKPLLSLSDYDVFFETLVDTMNKFLIPKPFVAPKRKQPLLSDEEYSGIVNDEEGKQLYQAELDEYNKKVKKDERKARYHEDLIRVKQIHKARSFDTLKVLVSLFPESVMKPDSRWINGNYLRMPKYQIGVEEEKISEDKQDGKTESSRKKKKLMIDQKLFGPTAHENQDFFDALFFSRILRACLVLENTIELTANTLDPFLKSFQITIFDSPLSFRYLKVVDKFIRITRFNMVANTPPPIINYKRYLIAYLIRNGANWMGIVPSKVQSRAINFEFLSLFEALHLYQVVDPSSAEERQQRMKALMSTKDIDYKLSIIYFTYNPIQYQTIATIIEEVSREVSSISFSKLNGYYEIFAMAKNIDLLPINERNVLKFKYVQKSPEDPVEGLQSNNENLPFRRPLPEHYEATFVWNMSRRLKNLSELGNHLNYPYGTFASRILLARRFGVSFDASNFIPQLSENFTWSECVDFVNFFLEREAQILINNANTTKIDSDLYQVYRVYDTQRHLHKTRQMDDDEPTHHLNLLIESALNGLLKEEADAIMAIHNRSHLFNLYKRGLRHIDPIILFKLSREQTIKILKWFLDDKNIPETFTLNLLQ